MSNKMYLWVLRLLLFVGWGSVIAQNEPQVTNVFVPSQKTPDADTTPTPNKVTLGEVFVNTALGFKKNEKTLSYSAQLVKADQFTTVKDANFTNALTGKASNVTITQGAGGAGSASNIILRGNNSLSGAGQPLIVIDGIPTVNLNQRPTTGQSQFGQNYLAPDALSAINPDDIDNVTILKGPAAAALYGSQAANGAIIITTKSGKDGVARINVSNNTTFQTAMYTPQLQTTYGGLGNGSYSWGRATPNAANAKSFYSDLLQTGFNTSNTVNLSAGNKVVQVFASYANTTGSGIMRNNNLLRNNFDLKGNANLLNNFLELEGKFSYMQQNIQNPYSPGSYLNPYYTLMALSADVNMKSYRQFQTPTGEQNWIDEALKNGSFDNPYWDINRVITTDRLNRLLASGSLKFNFTDWLNLITRGTIDKTNETYINKMYAGTNSTLAPPTTGTFNSINTENLQYYGDAIFNFNKDLVKDVFHVNALLGGAIRDYSATGYQVSGSRGNPMVVKDLFTLANLAGTSSGFSDIYDRRQIQSLFYSLELGYKNALFLTNTGRNDWSSTLPSNANSYFYPSIGASAVLTELIQSMQSHILNYLKLRLSYTQVGSDLPTFITHPVATISPTGSLVPPNTIIKPGTKLKPEITGSIEAGLDFALIDNLIRFEGTYYKTNTTNQLFTVAAPGSSGYANYYINGGNIQNQGVELSLSVSPNFGKLNWTSTINFSKNVNKVISLTEGVTQLIYSQLSNSTSYYQKVVAGGSLGDIYASKWKRNADGSLVINSTYVNGVAQPGGLPAIDEAKKVGNAFPDFLLSWSNTFSYKNFRISFLIDGRFGGTVIPLSQALLDNAGNSIASANDRNKGYVTINGQENTNVEGYYRLKGALGGPLGEYAYSATSIRLRELSLSYSFRSILEKTAAYKYIKDINVSFIARNLFFIYRAAPIDPEIVSNNAFGGQNSFLGLEIYNLPALRSFGFGVNFSF